MFGTMPAPDTEPPSGAPDGACSLTPKTERSVVLSVKNLTVETPDKPFIRNVGMEIHANTITGIAGIRDSGLETLEYALTGLIPVTSGAITLNNTALPLGKHDDLPATFRNAGMAYLNADRTNTCLAMHLPLWDNLVIHAHRRQPKRFFFLNKPLLDSWARTIMARAGCNRSTREAASSFSGGQLQRILIEREVAEIISPVAATGIAERTRLLILSEPGWGLDVRARKALADKLRSISQQNVSILLFSTDIDALLDVSDEILVLNNGAFSARIAIADRAVLYEYKTRVIQAMTTNAASYL
jgi:simple sugar transport system ATP-binding protein